MQQGRGGFQNFQNVILQSSTGQGNKVLLLLQVTKNSSTTKAINAIKTVYISNLSSFTPFTQSVLENFELSQQIYQNFAQKLK